MLTKWSLNNFKSFERSGEIELAPITVLAGANSSGKSTIIQSMLLLKQTVAYSSANRSIGLNGPILKLGRFDDVRNVQAAEKSIEFSWTLSEAHEYQNYGRNIDYFMPYYGLGQRFTMHNVECSIKFSVIEEPMADKTC